MLYSLDCLLQDMGQFLFLFFTIQGWAPDKLHSCVVASHMRGKSQYAIGWIEKVLAKIELFSE